MTTGPASNGRVVSAALAWLGTPYRHQASIRGVGCDCLGLIRGIWRDLYGEEPETAGPYTRDWAEAGRRDLMLEAARRHFLETERAAAPGRLLLFRWRPDIPAKHVGIAQDSGHFIHAYEGQGVVLSPLVPQWRRRIAAAFEFPPLEAG